MKNVIVTLLLALFASQPVFSAMAEPVAPEVLQVEQISVPVAEKGFTTKVMDFFSAIFRAIKNAFVWVFNLVKRFFVAIVDFFKSLFGKKEPIVPVSEMPVTEMEPVVAEQGAQTVAQPVMQ